MGRLWARVRRVWVTLGATVGVVFVGWSLLAYRATPDARAALQGNDRTTVERREGYWSFQPRREVAGTGLVFFPGALVDPAAYAPLAQEIAGHGYPVLIVELPRRGAFGGADSPEVRTRTRRAMRYVAAVKQWVVAGHSRGGVVAAQMVHTDPAGVVGLVLVGTSHPRDFSLAKTPVRVTRVYGTRDTVADVEKLEATRRNLPASTRMVAIDGGNHSQFGCYGFQPGDWPATVSRETQQRITRQALIDALDAAAAGADGGP
jgi:pimeloyl-ACP methyl ester carboxylesterase